MTRFNEHFRRVEFECHCGCGQDTVDAELLQVLTDLRVYTGQPVTITSGNRCWNHNEVVGSPKSKHPVGKAADIKVREFTPEEVYRLLDEWYPAKYGIGLYKTWVHIDVRPERARW